MLVPDRSEGNTTPAFTFKQFWPLIRSTAATSSVRGTLLTVLVLMGIFSSLFASGAADKPPESPKDSWTVAQGTYKGHPMFLRINKGLLPLAGKPPFQDRFGVTVPFRAPNENGLPNNSESEDLNRIEDDLLTTFTSSGKTLFAIVITTGGSREFVFYTSVAPDIAPAMERLKKQITSHELQFYVQPDKNWDVYRSFVR